MEQAASPTRIAVTPGRVVPGLERRQPAAGRLERHPRPQPADLVHQPLRRAAERHRLPTEAGCPRPLHRPGAAGSVPRRGDHRGLRAGQRGHVPLAGPGPRRARLRRADVRRAGPGRRRDAPPRARAPCQRRPEQRAAVLQPVRDTAGRRAVRLPRHAGPAAVQLRGRHRGRPVLLHLDARRSTTPTRAPRARR